MAAATDHESEFRLAKAALSWPTVKLLTATVVPRFVVGWGAFGNPKPVTNQRSLTKLPSLISALRFHNAVERPPNASPSRWR